MAAGAQSWEMFRWCKFLHGRKRLAALQMSCIHASAISSNESQVLFGWPQEFAEHSLVGITKGQLHI